MDSALTQAFTDYKRFHGIDFLPFQVEDGPIPEREKPESEEKSKKEVKSVPKREKRDISKRQVFTIQGRIIDEPLVLAVADYLGMDNDFVRQEQKDLGQLIEKIVNKIGSTDPNKVMRTLKKDLRKLSGGLNRYVHRQLLTNYRINNL